jgi:hypothetical protein
MLDSTSDLASGIALVFSLYNFWHSSQRPPQLRLFVPPVINYASPYQNSNFEVFAIPLTIINQGARTGTILSMNLVVTDLQSRASKRFYSANFGQWSFEKSQSLDFRPFAPISLAGRASCTDTVQFHTRGDEQVAQIVKTPGRYQFTIMIDSPSAEYGFLDQLLSPATKPLTFEMILQHDIDHRAFNHGNGTITLRNKSWQSSASA